MGFIQFLFEKKEEAFSEEEMACRKEDGKVAHAIMERYKESEIKAEVRKVKARYEVFKSESVKGDWYFRLVASNNRIICSSEGYTRKENALAGIKSVKVNAGRAKVVIL